MGANYQKKMEDRVSGMVYAYDFAERHGLEALKKELAFCRATYLQMEISTEKCDEIMEDVFTKIYNAYNVAVYKVLHDKYGFAEKRLKEFTDAFNSVVDDIATTDCYGEMLYTFGDYAKEFNTKYGMNLNMDKIEEVDALNKRSFGQKADVHAIEI
ncbi:hypothetical protein, partial [Frisingicoccus sp.]|uniref:hypothetical protein n=1 Tax=Frisingicoccus sp. TaxID=1918627 RepID=UPI003AB1DE33